MEVNQQQLNREIAQTVISLCKWIQDHLGNGTSSEELAVLPEVVKATANLANNVIFDSNL